MSTLTPQEVTELKREKRELLKTMRELGVKRVSCFNRVDDQSYRFNSRLFAINTKLGR